MKFLGVVLVIIAVLLGLIYLKLQGLNKVSLSFEQAGQAIVSSNQGIINSNQRLEESIGGLRKQLEEISDRITKK